MGWGTLHWEWKLGAAGPDAQRARQSQKEAEQTYEEGHVVMKEYQTETGETRTWKNRYEFDGHTKISGGGGSCRERGGG